MGQGGSPDAVYYGVFSIELFGAADREQPRVPTGRSETSRRRSGVSRFGWGIKAAAEEAPRRAVVSAEDVADEASQTPGSSALGRVTGCLVGSCTMFPVSGGRPGEVMGCGGAGDPWPLDL